MADTKDLSKGQQIASSGAPIKEAHALKKKDKDGNEIRLEELANFNPDIFLESHRNSLKRFHITALALMIISAILFVLAVTLCITFLILAGSEKKSIEELQATERSLNLGEWKLNPCQTCYGSNGNAANSITANMSRNKEKDSNETAPCEYGISNFWECDGLKYIEHEILHNSNITYYCVKN